MGYTITYCKQLIIIVKYIPTLHSIVMIMLCALFLHIYKLDHSLDDDQKILPISNVMAGYIINIGR